MHGSTLVRRALEHARRELREQQGLASPRPGHDGISRRALIKAIGAGAAMAAAPAVAAGPKPRSVAIVGSGLAGLVALDKLVEAGIEARLYEGRNRVGGRVFTVPDANNPGGWIEIGGQLVNSDHADMLALAKRFDIPLIDRKAMPGREVLLRDKRILDDKAFAAALMPIAGQIAADSERLDSEPDKAIAELDTISVAAYLDKHAALLLDPVVRQLLEQTIRTEFGAEPREASAVQLIFNLPTVDGEAYEILGKSDEHYVLAGGSGRIPAALAKLHADRIELNRRLVSISRGPGGVTLRFDRGAPVTADRVILTVPAPVLGTLPHGGLFSPKWAAFAREVRLGRCAKLNAPYRSRPWAQSAMGPAGSTWDLSKGATFAEVWECTMGQTGSGGTLTWYLGGDQVNAARDRLGLRASVEAAVGGAMGDPAGAALPNSLVTGWLDDPFTRGAYTNFRPGQFIKYGGQLWLEEQGVAKQIARSGPIFFAGEHVSDAWPGFMNGGAQTGRLAAQAIIDGI
ncbi:flavin monoamine oxidase family protein [Sphingobium nicotianae]|uniref:Tryptophan 2-monooxygenase n=1 Tax=Sphingobium nicotianae TaxID=2782607 RepID=A0A9X1IQ29_9SPHN|nr:NAD(P)/FAD-dependent oxidoreductase [Sphingobium nicotianae]MBT2186316.1 FAD-dependent oxidoreductase [Sphingobium nicotianae]